MLSDMKKLIASLLVGAQLALSVPTFAQDAPAKQATAVTIPQAPTPLPGEPDVGAAVSPMRRGQVSPFTGILLSPKAIATIMVELNSIQDVVKIETDRVKAEADARCEFRVSQLKIAMEADAKIAQAKLDARQRELDVVTERLKKVENSSPDPLLWGGLGFGAGALSVILTIVIVQATER